MSDAPGTGHQAPGNGDAGSSTHDSSLITHHSFPGWTPAFQAALERLAIAVRRPARSQHPGAVRSRMRGRALEFADYRPYSPGDDPRLVDWRAYTRLGRLFLKQYEEERARSLTLLIDASASLDWGDNEVHKGLYARRLAAALAWIALGRQEPVRACLLREGDASHLPPTFGRPGAVALFRQLAAVRETGGTSLVASIRKATAKGVAGPVVLLTDLLDPSWPGALDRLAGTGEGVLLQLLAPDEWEPPLGEEVELQDLETGELRATRLGPIELATYRDRLSTFLRQVESHCNRVGLSYLALNTAISLQQVVLRKMPAAHILVG